MLGRVIDRKGMVYVAGVVGVFGVSAIGAPYHDRLDHTAVALGYLLVVLLVAATWGRWPAMAASAISVLCFDFFFLPPIHTLTFGNPQDWVALVAFLVTAVTAGHLSELAKRRVREAEAIRTEARLTGTQNRSLLEATLDALVTIGLNGKINDINGALETVTGRSRQELIGTDFSDCFVQSEMARAAYREVLRDGFVRDRPFEIRHRDGRVTSVLYSGSIYRDNAGTPIGVVAAARSISSSAARPSVALADPRLVRSLERFVAVASLLSVAVGLLGLIGWTFGIGVLKSAVRGQPIIKPNEAIALVLCGASLWLLRSKSAQSPSGSTTRAGHALAFVVASLGLLSLSEHLTGWNFGIDQLFFVDENPWEAFGRICPGLMAPLTALDLFLIGLALLWLDWTIVYKSRRYRPAQFLAFVANTGSMLGLFDVVLGYQTAYTQIALQTAITLFVFTFAVGCARTDLGLGALFVSSSDGGMLTRRLWPATMVVPLLLGTASSKGYFAGVLSEWSAISVMLVAMITLLAGLTIWSGQSIDRRDIERRQVEALRHRSEDELREAQRLARMGSWCWEPATNTVTWSEGLFRIAFRDPKLPLPEFNEYPRFFTPESYARLIAAVETAARKGTPFELALNLVRSDGAIRSVTSRGEAERDRDGRVILVRGSIQDVTEQQQAEEALRRSEASLKKAQEIAHLGNWRLDVASGQVTWSDEVYRIFGIPSGTPITRESAFDLVHPADRETAQKAWAASVQDRVPYDVELRIVVGGTTKWARGRGEVEFDKDGRTVAGIGTVQDITERKLAQEELLRANRAHRALSRCNEALIRATEESAWLEQVCRIIIDEAGYRFCWVGRAEDDEAKTVTPVGQAGANGSYLNTVNVTWADTESGQGPTGTCIRTGRTQIVKDTATDSAVAQWRMEALRHGYASIIAIPLMVGGKRFGSLSIYAAEAEAFHEEEVKLLSELAGDLGYGVTTLRVRAERERSEEEIRTLNAELEQRVRARTADLEAARDREAKIGFRIQQMLLLTQPPSDVPGLQVAALTLPSERIDGDFYDFFKHENQCLDVIVADVMGKGVPAALLAAATKSNFLEALSHLTAMSGDGHMPEPKEIVTLAHADMVRQLIDLESFVTLTYARFDLSRRYVDLVDCGHTGMMVVHTTTGRYEILHGDNLPLGVREGEIFDQIRFSFGPGDLFLLYSDGITDIRNPAGEFYGTERLAACVRANLDLEPQMLVEAIRRNAVAFGQSDRLTDDLTCVVLRVGEAQQPLARSEIEIRSTLEDLCRARAFVREFTGQVPEGFLDEDTVADLELAVNEAASNIMKHAYHGRADQHIQLDAEMVPHRVSVRLHHLGESFDPSAASPPALDGSRESGFGIYLISRSIDEARYSRDERGRNCITLVKMLHAPESGRAS